MDLLKEIFANEVFPAIGCTEPISCAYAAAAAAEQLPAPAEKIILTVDPATYKNGAAVTIPYSGGEKGNVIAAAMGAALAQSALRLEILKGVTPEVLKKARALIKKGALDYRCKEGGTDFHVEVTAEGGGSRVRCLVSDGHTNITALEKDGVSILTTHPHAGTKEKGYRDRMRGMKLEEVLREVTVLDEGSRAYLRRGIDMNMAIVQKGVGAKHVAYQMQEAVRAGVRSIDLFYKVTFAVASAVDARMSGMPEPVMTSGGSGNQGILTILGPYIVGTERKVPAARIEESVAISHAVNSYIKCFTGELSVICGCAIAAAVSAAVAIVYQNAGIDMRKITFAVNNVIGDLCGIICDGAKPGCAMKIASGAETAMRSAFMAVRGYGLSPDDGVLGASCEESIRNLRAVSLDGMFLIDPTVVHILKGKVPRSGRA